MPDDAKFPPNFKATIEDTRDLVKKLIDRVATVAGAAGDRWIDGYTRTEVEATAVDTGAKLKDQVLDAWDTAEKAVKPPKTGGPQ